MPSEPPVSEVERELRRRRPWTLVPITIIVVLLLLVGLVATIVGLSQLLRLALNTTPTIPDPVAHFAHGSIGAEIDSGLPLHVFNALPRLFPKEFEGRPDYTAFGFLYPTNEKGERDELPYGFSRRNYRGVELVWFNCAVCHVGTWRRAEGERPNVVLGMPSNNLDLHRFIRFIVGAATDERLSPDSLLGAIRDNGTRLNPIDKLVWRFYVLPRVREGLLARNARLGQYIADQPQWGPGRVDTFNGYKLIQMQIKFDALAPSELRAASDFPAIFNQRPREGMQLHWDGNNASLQERNLSAALGAGVTARTADHPAIGRVADWLKDLRPPPSPHKVDPAEAQRGRTLYMANCAGCHGYQAEGRYVFEGAMLGKVDPNARLGTDAGRLNAYTEYFRQRQLAELFAGTPYQFKHFVKTDGYANVPLDGLWLRGPYLHNGSVPTLRALLSPPAERPVAYLRSSDIVDGANGGFMSPPCTPGTPQQRGFCYDTRVPGNGNGGHLYGTSLPQAEKADLLAYLLTF